MIKTLQDARISDGLPRILKNQDWVKAISEAMGTLHGQTMGFILQSQIYTELDKAPEEVLDALAANWKVDWYNTDWTIDQKRRTVISALTIRRRMGTKESVRLQIESIYPGTILEEWFDYGGEPGYYRMYLNISDTGPGNTVELVTPEEIQNKLLTARRMSAHLESMSYMVRHQLKIHADVGRFPFQAKECGVPRCGTEWEPATVGWSDKTDVNMDGRTDGHLAEEKLTGTIPDTAQNGFSVADHMKGQNRTDAMTAEEYTAGTKNAGTEPQEAARGYTQSAKVGMWKFTKALTDNGDTCGTQRASQNRKL